MTSSYSSDLKLELMVTGENAGTWGDKTNNNLNLVQICNYFIIWCLNLYDTRFNRKILYF